MRLICLGSTKNGQKSLTMYLDMYVYQSTAPTGNVFYPNSKEQLPLFVCDNIKYGDWNEKRAIDLDVNLPKVIHSSKNDK